MKKNIAHSCLVRHHQIFLLKRNQIVYGLNKFQRFNKPLRKQKQEIDGLTSKVNTQQTTINQQRNALYEITTKATRLESTVDSLGSLIETNRSNINTIADDLGTKIQETGEQAETRISELGGDVEKKPTCIGLL